MYVVTGVGGYVGAQTARRLLELLPANQITVTSRNDAVLAEWRAKGARACKADYNDKASLIEAFRGAEAVFLVSAMEVGEKRQAQHRNAVEAAKEAGASAVALSGAGPSLIAFSSKAEVGIGESMKRAFEQAGLTARIFNLGISSHGAEIQI